MLESEVSKKELAVLQATTKRSFFLLSLANIILVLAFSRFVSRRLVRNIERAASKVRDIQGKGDLKERIRLKGTDEVAYLTGEFDRLLDSLEESQQKVIEAEKVHAKIEMAMEVAHNIRSPIIALEMLQPLLSKVPQHLQSILKNSVKEIKALSERLKHDNLINIHSNRISKVNLEVLIQNLIEEKKIEYSGKSQIQFEFSRDNRGKEIFVKVDPVEIKAVVSNVINNAVDSYGGYGKVEVSCKTNGLSDCSIVVKDFGSGISTEVLPKLGNEIVSTKANGSGVGLFHAYKNVVAWGGRIEIDSRLNEGTTIMLTLPKISSDSNMSMESSKSL